MVSVSKDGLDITCIITKTKISQERNRFRTSNLDHRVLRAILHLKGLSICTEKVVYIWNLRVTYSFISLQCNSVPHHHRELVFISFSSVSEAIV